MNWIRENKFLAGLLAIVLIAGIALIVLLVMAYSRFSEISASYDNSQRELDRLKGSKIFPSTVNVEALEKQKEEYQSELAGLRRELATIEFPLEDVSPNQFQDRLRDVVSEIQNRASEKDVELPDDFYLGYGQYQTELPREGAAPVLNRQLDSVKLIAEKLMDFGISKLEFIERTPLPEELGVSRDSKTSVDEKAPEDLISKEILNVSFVSSAAVLQDVINAIVDAKSFLIVRTLTVKNEMQDGPIKGAISEPTRVSYEDSSMSALFGDATDETDDAAAGGVSPAERLQFLVGQEKLNVTMLIEILDFADPEEK